MRLPGVPYTPSYTSDEKVLGVVVALALHVVIIGPFVYRAMVPSARSQERRSRSSPGPWSRPRCSSSASRSTRRSSPIGSSRRRAPRRRAGRRVAGGPGQGEAGRGTPTAERAGGLRPHEPRRQERPVRRGRGKRRPEEGHESGVDGGTETDPSKVRAGDMYATQLGQFFGQHLNVPTVISIGEERRLCAVYEVQINRQMVIWYVRQAPVKTSGNELFDDAARTMLQKLLDDRTPLPQPPKEVDELYRGRRLQIVVTWS